MLQSIAIVGGSIGGLFTGIALLAKGYEVHIFERSSGRMEDRGGGLVIQEGIQAFFTTYQLADLTDYSVPLTYRQFFDREGNVEQKLYMPQPMTSWNRLYRILKDNFPSQFYHANKKVVRLENSEEDVTLFFADGTKVTMDFVVGADGVGSALRQYLVPESKPEYAGYVAWRGAVPIVELPSRLRESFYDYFTFYTGPETQMLTYFIPDTSQEAPIRANFVWYINLVDKEELEKMMVGEDGQKFNFTVPPHKVANKFVEEMKQVVAPKLLPPQFQELVQLIKQPYVQPIYDLTVPQMAFERMLLLGDAAFVLRPHTGAGVNKAAINALSLAVHLPDAENKHDVAQVRSSLEQWAKGQLQLGYGLVTTGKRLGDNIGLGYGGLSNR